MKRLAGLRELSDDHHTGLVLARRCKRVGRSASERSLTLTWEQVLETFSRLLEPHFQIEEQHLLPALEALGETRLAGRIRAEHAALRTLRKSTPPTHALVEQFGELLAAHIRFEERQVFEPVQQRLPEPVLHAIASACHAVPPAGAPCRTRGGGE